MRSWIVITRRCRPWWIGKPEAMLRGGIRADAAVARRPSPCRAFPNRKHPNGDGAFRRLQSTGPCAPTLRTSTQSPRPRSRRGSDAARPSRDHSRWCQEVRAAPALDGRDAMAGARPPEIGSTSVRQPAFVGLDMLLAHTGLAGSGRCLSPWIPSGIPKRRLHSSERLEPQDPRPRCDNGADPGGDEGLRRLLGTRPTATR